MHANLNANQAFDDVVVAGVKFENRQLVVRSLQTGQQLLLRRDPGNPYNPNAIRVDTLDERSVGFLKDGMANELAARFDRYGAPVYAKVVAVTGGYSADSLYGVRIYFELPNEQHRSSTPPDKPVSDSSYSDLTTEQRKIVCHPLNRHARIMAVAGSGKTFTMVYRIKYLIEQCGIQPRSVCVLMFNAWAREQFKARLEKVIPDSSLRPTSIHTFHSFSYSVLKEASKGGLGKDGEEEWTEDKQERSYIWMHRAIDALVNRGEIDQHSVMVDDAMTCVGLWKGALIPPNRAGHRTNPAMPKVYAEYEYLRVQEHATTYDDYVPDAVHLLEGNSELGRKFRNRFRVVIVDEYQDVNYSQQKLVEILAGTQADVMVVGDDDQTIYEWRGARPDYLSSRFEHVFSNKPLDPYTLSNTFRFGPVLAQCASNVIVNNQARVAKHLIARNVEQESTVTVFDNSSEQRTDTDKDLADAVKLLIRETADPQQVIVLARLYSQFASLEAEFLKQKIPYRVHGRAPFFERQEVATLLNYLRLGESYHCQITGESLAWLLSALNRPNRFLKKAAFSAMAESMPTSTIAEILTAVEDRWSSRLNDKDRAKAAEYHSVVCGLHERMSSEYNATVGRLLRWLVAATDYIKHYDNFYGVGDSSDERKGAISALLKLADESCLPPRDFLEYVEKLNPGRKKPIEEQVVMTTIFKVKGEEFDYVVIPGCTEGNMPCLHYSGNPIYDTAGIVAEPVPSDALENERRLFYVGVTPRKEGRDNRHILSAATRATKCCANYSSISLY